MLEFNLTKKNKKLKKNVLIYIYFFMQNIFNSHRKTKRTFYIIQITSKNKIFSFTKFILISLTSKTLKILEEIIIREFNHRIKIT